MIGIMVDCMAAFVTTQEVSDDFKVVVGQNQLGVFLGRSWDLDPAIHPYGDRVNAGPILPWCTKFRSAHRFLYPYIHQIVQYKVT
jgi:hypothetical protein